jgi:hypothetical protein
VPEDSHERPLLLVLPSKAAIGDAFVALLSHEEVRAYALPALWSLRFGRVDALASLPDVAHLDLENLPGVVAWMLSAATPAARESLIATAWDEAHERVREFYLRRSTLAILATIFKIGKSTRGIPPPALFASDQVHEARFEAVYRLYPLPGAKSDREVPAEEGSIVFYPFDPEDSDAHREVADLREQDAVVEVFAYDAGRERHRAWVSSVAAARGWRVVDPIGP